MIMPVTGRPKTGRPSLGDRAIMTATLPNVALRAVDNAATAHSISRSTVLTDIVCEHYGRRDLARIFHGSLGDTVLS